MQVKEYSERFKKFADGFGTKVVSVIQQNGDTLTDYVREQLYSGLDGNEKPLRPTYLQDPWFNSPDAGRWQGKAKAYMAWKSHITPSAPSYIGLPGRPIETPNLIITGVFYDSIHAAPVQGGALITTEGVDFGRDIERKYGSDIFKISPRARYDFLITKLMPEIQNFWNESGL